MQIWRLIRKLVPGMGNMSKSHLRPFYAYFTSCDALRELKCHGLSDQAFRSAPAADVPSDCPYYVVTQYFFYPVQTWNVETTRVAFFKTNQMIWYKTIYPIVYAITCQAACFNKTTEGRRLNTQGLFRLLPKLRTIVNVDLLHINRQWVANAIRRIIRVTLRDQCEIALMGRVFVLGRFSQVCVHNAKQ